MMVAQGAQGKIVDIRISQSRREVLGKFVFDQLLD